MIQKNPFSYRSSLDLHHYCCLGFLTDGKSKLRNSFPYKSVEMSCSPPANQKGREKLPMSNMYPDSVGSIAEVVRIVKEFMLTENPRR